MTAVRSVHSLAANLAISGSPLGSCPVKNAKNTPRRVANRTLRPPPPAEEGSYFQSRCGGTVVF
jgi:hypothetical protein